MNSRDREATTNNNNAITEKHATRESNNSRGLGLSFESEDQNLFDDDAIQGPRTRAQEKTFKYVSFDCELGIGWIELLILLLVFSFNRSIVQPNHPNAPYREEDQNPLSLLQSMFGENFVFDLFICRIHFIIYHLQFREVFDQLDGRGGFASMH